MEINYNVKKVDYNNRLRNLDVTAQSKVKSDKFFPVFDIDGKEKIFKPLSKTKPLTTPYFAYSEVVWSTIIHSFFDPSTPIYELAIIENIKEYFPNKYHHGVLVDNIIQGNEKLVNLYEYFRDNPDPAIDIIDYENYCLKFYDYKGFFDTNFMIENENIAEKFAYQILLSILKCDQNYHYENPLFGSVEGKIVNVKPMIDHEFSTMFLFVDDLLQNEKYFGSALTSLILTDEIVKEDIFAPYKYEAFGTISKNLDVILNRYPSICYKFLENLKKFVEHIKRDPIVLQDYGYLVPFNSMNYEVGYQLYKKNNIEKSEEIKKELENQQFSPNIEKVSTLVNEEILASSTNLGNEMIRRLERLNR